MLSARPESLAQHVLDLLRLRRRVEVRQKVADHTASPFEELVMSVSGISSSSLFDFQTQNLQNNKQQFQQAFQQLGQDLQSGNLSAAQADFATLQPSAPQANSTLANSPIGQAFAQISRDLQSRNLSAAQQDYATVQKDFKVTQRVRTIIIRVAVAEPMPSASCWRNWASRCSRAIFPPPSRHTAHCNRTSSLQAGPDDHFALCRPSARLDLITQGWPKRSCRARSIDNGTCMIAKVPFLILASM
jgi:hypothetical protein